jgi:hypothetical protein
MSKTPKLVWEAEISIMIDGAATWCPQHCFSAKPESAIVRARKNASMSAKLYGYTVNSQIRARNILTGEVVEGVR